MASSKSLCCMFVLALAAACGGGETPPPAPHEQVPAAETPPPASQQQVLTAETLGAQSVASTRDYLADPRYADTDRRNGELRAQVCRACHSLEPDGPNLLGPNLHGVFGKPVGSVEDYDYSAVLEQASFVWTPRALDAWLAQPARFLPGNRMSFPGVLKESDRNDLIAYLLEVTDDNDSG